MILVYQIFHGLIDINPSIFFAPAIYNQYYQRTQLQDL